MGNWPDFGTPWGPHLCLARRRFVGTLDTQAAGIGGLQQCSRWSCNVRNEDVLFRCPYGTGTLCKSGGDAKSLCHLGLERLIVSEKGANSGGIWYLDMFCFQQINTHTQHLGGMWKDEICGELYRILRLWERDSGGKHQSDAQYIAKCSSLAYGEHHALCHLVCRTYACVTRGIFGFETSTDAVYFLEYSRIWHVIFVGVWVVC